MQNGLFSWIGSLLTLSDGLLLPLAGFDGYSTIQSLKLTFGLLLFMAVPALGILVPFYYSQSNLDHLTYMSFSITSIYGTAVWVPTVVCWVVSLVTFYVVYVFYRNFSTIRQIYLTNPSALMSFESLRHRTNDLGSVQDARKYFNISTRAVLLQSISSDYGPTELKRLLENAGIGPVVSVQQVQSPELVEGHLARRQRTINKLEMDLMAFFETLKRAALRPDTPEWRALQAEPGSGDLARSDLLSRIASLPRLSVQERCVLVRRLLTEPAFMAEYRPTHKSRHNGLVDSLSHRYAKLMEREACVHAAIRDFTTFHTDELIRMEHPTLAEEDLSAPNEGYVQKTSLITLRKTLQVRSNLVDLRTTLWGSSYAAIVVFRDKRAATACRQLLLSSRLFSLKAQAMPLADDFIWSNAVMPKADRVQREMLGDILYITLNLFFIPVTSALAVLTNLESLQTKVPIIGVIVRSHPKLKTIIQGILAPLAYNLAIFVAPHIMHLILRMQGKTSRSEIQMALMSKYAWFLFFQTSIIGVVFSSVLELLIAFWSHGYESVFDKIRTTMPSKSHFFANIVFQRAFIGLMLILLQPAVLFKKLAFSVFWPRSRRTPRAKLTFHNPKSILPGIIFPDFIVFPYQITMAFITITPLSVIPGLLFYGLASFVFKHQFVYSYAVPNESGGMYWRRLSVHLMAGVLMNQIFSVIVFSQYRAAIFPSFLMALLIGLTLAYIPFLERTFGPVCDNLPLTGEDRMRKRSITADLIHKQTHLLQVLQPIETAPVVFARLDSEGEQVEGWEQTSVSPTEILSLSSFTKLPPVAQEKQALTLSASATTVTAIPVPVPIIHQSSTHERRSYEVVPVQLTDAAIATFDPYDLDFLTDRSYVDNPYQHPAMLAHTQVFMLPAALPALLKAVQARSYKSAEEGQNNPASDSSPIVMGESAVSSPEDSPRHNPYTQM